MSLKKEVRRLTPQVPRKSTNALFVLTYKATIYTPRFDMVLGCGHCNERCDAVCVMASRQMASKADTDEVTRALSSAGNKLHKLGVIIPAIQEELSNKIERKDLAK